MGGISGFKLKKGRSVPINRDEKAAQKKHYKPKISLLYFLEIFISNLIIFLDKLFLIPFIHACLLYFLYLYYRMHLLGFRQKMPRAMKTIHHCAVGRLFIIVARILGREKLFGFYQGVGSDSCDLKRVIK